MSNLKKKERGENKATTDGLSENKLKRSEGVNDRHNLIHRKLTYDSTTWNRQSMALCKYKFLCATLGLPPRRGPPCCIVVVVDDAFGVFNQRLEIRFNRRVR